MTTIRCCPKHRSSRLSWAPAPNVIFRSCYPFLGLTVLPMPIKSERVTLLTSPDFKAFLSAEARREGVSVAELVRSRCERRPSEEEQMLAALTAELNKNVAEAKRALKSGLDDARAVLDELHARAAGSARTAARRGRPAARGA